MIFQEAMKEFWLVLLLRPIPQCIQTTILISLSWQTYEISQKNFYGNIKCKNIDTDGFQSRGQQLCKLLGIKQSFNMWKEFNSHRIFFVHKQGRWFIVLYTNMAAVTSCENDL